MSSSEVSPKPSSRAVDVVLTARLDPIDAHAANSILERLARVHSETVGSSIDVEGQHSGSLLALSIRSDAPSILRLVDGRLTSGDKLLDERAATELTARVMGVSSTKAATISNHLMNAAQNRPEEDAGLDIVTEHDAIGGQFTATLKGSLFATTYLLFLIHLQMTQSRT